MLLSWHDFLNPKFASPLTWLSIIHIDRKDLFLIMHVLGVCLHIPILSTSVYQSNTTLHFRCRHRWTLELAGRRWSYPDVVHSSRFGRPSWFRGRLPIIFYLRYRFELVEYAPLAFLSHLISDIVLVPFFGSIHLMQYVTIYFIWWS